MAVVAVTMNLAVRAPGVPPRRSWKVSRSGPRGLARLRSPYSCSTVAVAVAAMFRRILWPTSRNNNNNNNNNHHITITTMLLGLLFRLLLSPLLNQYR